jgi:acyl carrier protein
MSYVDKVRDFVVEVFLFGDDAGLGEDTSFLETGIVDSTGILELVAFLEETFRVSVTDAELIPENLDTLSNIERFLEKKLGAGVDS